MRNKFPYGRHKARYAFDSRIRNCQFFCGIKHRFILVAQIRRSYKSLIVYIVFIALKLYYNKVGDYRTVVFLNKI